MIKQQIKPTMLTFHPKPGTVLVCNFNTGFQEPEMTKVRPVILISRKLERTDQVCTVVPLSTTKPNYIKDYHHRLDPASLPRKFAGEEVWAKCDMLTTISLARLDRVFLGKDTHGKRIYANHSVTEQDFKAIQRGVLCALGLKRLTNYL